MAENIWVINDSLFGYAQEFNVASPEWELSFGTAVMWSFLPTLIGLNMIKTETPSEISYDVNSGMGTINVQKSTTVLDIHLQLEAGSIENLQIWQTYDSTITAGGQYTRDEQPTQVVYTSIVDQTSQVTLQKTSDGSIDMHMVLDLSLVAHGWEGFTVQLEAGQI